MPPSPPSPDASAHAPRTRPIDETPELAARAVELIRTPPAIVQMTTEEARQVVAFMRLVRLPAGTVLFHAGDRVGAGYLLLLLEGQITVDAGRDGPPDAVPIAVVGPGSIIGEMSLLDGAPHSATCTAATPVNAAGLSRGGLERLIEEHPRVAAKLMVGVSQRIADRLRSLGLQLQMYARLTESLEAQNASLRGAGAGK